MPLLFHSRNRPHEMASTVKTDRKDPIFTPQPDSLSASCYLYNHIRSTGDSQACSAPSEEFGPGACEILKLNRFCPTPVCCVFFVFSAVFTRWDVIADGGASSPCAWLIFLVACVGIPAPLPVEGGSGFVSGESGDVWVELMLFRCCVCLYVYVCRLLWVLVFGSSHVSSDFWKYNMVLNKAECICLSTVHWRHEGKWLPLILMLRA